MSAGNTASSFGYVTKTFHWLTLLLVLTVIPLGIVANEMAHDLRDPSITSTTQDIQQTFWLFSLHKTVGIAIFFVAVARVLWAITQPKPGFLDTRKRIESTLAQTVHWLLYGSLILVPLAGWISHSAVSGFAPILWPFGQSLPFVPQRETVAAFFAGLHIVLERILVLSILLHVLGALKHHFWNGDATLRRMLPGSPPSPEIPSQHRSPVPAAIAFSIWALAIAIAGLIAVFGGT